MNIDWWKTREIQANPSRGFEMLVELSGNPLFGNTIEGVGSGMCARLNMQW
jgi:hypothetical protein